MAEPEAVSHGMGALPHHRVARVGAARSGAWQVDWYGIAPLQPFLRADGTAPAAQRTGVRVCHDGSVFFVRFDCEDRDVWGTYARRDDPIFEEEVVELFLAPGTGDPHDYFEFEVSPLGVLFDARVHNPTSLRSDLRADVGWDCPGIRIAAGADPSIPGWWAEIAVPWSSIAPPDGLPSLWRANFYRIERPRDGDAEFSCWSPTLTDPPDFHRPARFGTLEIDRTR